MIAIRVIAVLLVAMVATMLGLFIALDPGHVLVRYGGWELVTSVWAAIAALLFLAIATYYVFKILISVLRSNTKFARWFSAKRMNSAQRQTVRAIEEETNGNVVEAIRLLIAAGSQHANPILHYLRASELADRIGAKDKAAELREDAGKLGGDEVFVFARFNEAAALLLKNDKQRGIRALRRLLEDHPRCAPALLMLVQHCLDIEDWLGALDYLAVLERLPYIDEVQLSELTTVSWLGRIHAADVDELKKIWRSVPRKLKSDSQLLMAYAEALNTYDRIADAERALEKGLKQKWEGEWVRIYGRIKGDAEAQLRKAEGWRADHADDADLALTIGRLHCRLSHDFDARSHLERSVTLGAGPDAELELAELYFENGSLELGKNLLDRVRTDLKMR